MAGYGDDQGLEAWLTANGLTMPETAPSSAVLRQRGSSYIDGLYGSQFAERRFPGVPTEGVTQDRAWPRTGATVYGSSIADDAIPAAVIEASYVAAWYEGNNLGSLSVIASAAGAVKREKVASLEVEYFGGSGNVAADATPILSQIEGLLAPYLVLKLPNGPALWAIG